MGRVEEEHKTRIKIDVKDKKILVLLAENSRRSLSEIAKRVELSRDSVRYRMTRLQKLGVIVGYFPEIDFTKLGYRQYHVFMLVNETDKIVYNNLIQEISQHPHTRRIVEYSDRWDLEWVLLARNVEEYDAVLSAILAKYADIIMDKVGVARIETYYSILLPFDYYHTKSTSHKRNLQSYTPDIKDMKILQALGRDGRASTYDLAKSVKLSADAIGIRMKKLLGSGIIRKFSIAVNFSLLHYSMYAFALQMRSYTKKEERKFQEYVKDHKHIIKAVKTLGEYDVITYIIADHTKNFHSTAKRIKTDFFTSVKNYDTFVAYKEHTFCAMPKIVLQHKSL